MTSETSSRKGRIIKVERFCVHDGPGIRTVVYLKGCPLRCRWCANPEGQSPQTELMIRRERCAGCGACVRAGLSSACAKPQCPWDEKGMAALAAVCPHGVYLLCGFEATVETLMREIERDARYYGDEGGLTLSGGEVMAQADFSAELLETAQRRGYHTVVETCGYGTPEALRKVLSHCDAVYFDVKHLDGELHKRYTGVGNAQIRKNLYLADGLGIPIVLRVPMIPAFNMTDKFIKGLGRLAASLKNVKKIHLLAYHEMGACKYEWLRRPYEMKGARSVAEAELKKYLPTLKRLGTPVQVGGLEYMGTESESNHLVKDEGT